MHERFLQYLELCRRKAKGHGLDEGLKMINAY